MNHQPISECKLCRKRRKLCESHIIPERFYKPLYHAKPRRLQSVRMDGRPAPHLQKGIRERLLCVDCERDLNTRYEIPFGDWWFNEVLPKPRDWRDITVLNNADYPSFKLFHLSVLWRAAVASNKLFRRVKIGQFEQRIRHMLIAQDPGKPTDFPIICTATLANGKQCAELLLEPVSYVIDRTRIHRFVFGGCEWLYLLTQGAVWGEIAGFAPLFPRADGRVFLLKEQIDETLGAAAITEILRRSGKVISALR